jgi:SAM-dependent methyltransferase
LRPLTSLKLRVQDLLERDPLVPPRRLQHVGPGDFAATGDEFLRHLIELAGLQPHERVLDVGCGIGRLARPLADFLDERGSYAGFDVNPVAVGWCQARYDVKRFSFALADLYNARFHPTGRGKAAQYAFPYEADSFDVAILASVLTHLLEAEAEHYLSETLRVLRPGGRALATFFLLDDTSRAAIAEGRSALAFLEPSEHVAVLREDLPEDAVAYDEAWVRTRAPVRDVHPGGWRGRPGRSFQDIVVVEDRGVPCG